MLVSVTRFRSPALAGLLFCIAALAGTAQASESVVGFGVPRIRDRVAGGDVAFVGDAVAYSRRTAPTSSTYAYQAEIVMVERPGGNIRWSLPLTLANDQAPVLATTGSGRLVASLRLSGSSLLLVIDPRNGSVLARHDVGELWVFGLHRVGTRLFAYGYVDEGEGTLPVAIELDAEGGFVRRIKPAVAARDAFYFDAVLENSDGSVVLHAYDVETRDASFFYHARLFALGAGGEIGPEIVPPAPAGVPDELIDIQAALPHPGGYWIAGRYRTSPSSDRRPYLASVDPQGQLSWMRSDLPPGATSGSIVDLVADGNQLLTLGVAREGENLCIATLRLAVDGNSPATGACDAVPPTLRSYAWNFELGANGSARVVGYDERVGEPLAAFEWRRDEHGNVGTRSAPLAPADTYARIVFEPGGNGIAFQHPYWNAGTGKFRVVFGLSDFAAGARYAFEPGEPIAAMVPPFPVEGSHGRLVLVRESDPQATIDLATIDADWRPMSRVPFGPGGLPGFEAHEAVVDDDGVVYALGKDAAGVLVAAHSDTPWSARPRDAVAIAHPWLGNPFMQAGPGQAFLLLSQDGDCGLLAMDANGVQREETLGASDPVALLRSPQGRLLALCGAAYDLPRLFDATGTPAIPLDHLPCRNPIVGLESDGTLVAFTLHGEKPRRCRRSPSGQLEERTFALPAGAVRKASVENGVLHAAIVSDGELTLVRVRADLGVDAVAVPRFDAGRAVEPLAFGPGGLLLAGHVLPGETWRAATVRVDGAPVWTREFGIGDDVLPPQFTLGRVAWDGDRPVLNVAASLRFGGPEAASARIDVQHVFYGGFEPE